MKISWPTRVLIAAFLIWAVWFAHRQGALTQLYEYGAGFFERNWEGFNKQDVAALRRIKRENDTQNTLNWTGKNCDTWAGVIWTDSVRSRRVEKLKIAGKKLTGNLSVSDLKELLNLDCSSNDLTGLNVGASKKLTDITCSFNRLTALDVARLPNLEWLLCESNQLTVLDVGSLVRLSNLTCSNNRLTELDVARLTRLKDLRCSSNSLETLAVGELKNLRVLFCARNRLTELEISTLTGLKYLYCDNNSLTTLNVAPLKNLEYLFCYRNQLDALDVAELTKLIELRCSFNRLATLDVASLTNLTTLLCEGNRLKALDVASLTKLEYLFCFDNPLESPDVTNLTRLVDFRGSRRPSDASKQAAPSDLLSLLSQQVQSGDVKSAAETLAALQASTSKVPYLEHHRIHGAKLMVYGLVAAGDQTGALRMYEDLCKMCEQATKTPDAMDARIQAATALIGSRAGAGNFASAIAIYKELAPPSPSLESVSLRGERMRAVQALLTGYCQKGDLKGAEKWYDELQNLRISGQDLPNRGGDDRFRKIDLMMVEAETAAELVHVFGKNGRFDKALEYYQQVEDLRKKAGFFGLYALPMQADASMKMVFFCEFLGRRDILPAMREDFALIQKRQGEMGSFEAEPENRVKSALALLKSYKKVETPGLRNFHDGILALRSLSAPLGGNAEIARLQAEIAGKYVGAYGKSKKSGDREAVSRIHQALETLGREFPKDLTIREALKKSGAKP